MKAIRWNPDRHGDAYAYYAHLRRTAPVLRAAIPTRGTGWVVTRYDDVLTVLKDNRFSNDPRTATRPPLFGFGGRLAPRLIKIVSQSMLWSDDPAHARLRALVSKVFTPRAIDAMDGRIQEIVDQTLDEIAGREPVDLLSAFALPLPLNVISELLGVPESIRLSFHHMIMRLIEVSDRPVMRAIRWAPALPKLLRMFEDMIDEKRRRPDDGLISQLIAVEDKGDHLSKDELVGMIFLLLFAGHETSVNLICSGLLALIDYPEQMRLLQTRPDMIDTAVEELLRYTCPVEYGTMRFAKEDLTMGGVAIAKGDMVMALASSANRDETAFVAPDTLDLTRTNNRHLGLGFGLHYCLGAGLGRLETRVALGTLLRRFPDLRLAVPRDEIRWRHANGLRGVAALPILLGADQTAKPSSAATPGGAPSHFSQTAALPSLP